MTKRIKQFSQKHKWFVFGILPILLIGTIASFVYAAAFDDGATGDWDIGTTWGGACGASCTEGTDYPGAADTATIDSHTVTLTGTQAVDDITIASGGTFVGGSFWFEVHGGWSNTGGTFTANSSTVIFASTQGTENIDPGSSSFNDVALNDGLVGYWKFDETGGTIAYDSSGYGNDGTYNSGAVASTTVPTLSFSNPRSISLPTSGDYIDVPDADILSFTDGSKNDKPFTFAFWIRPTAWDIVDGPISKDDGATREYYMYIIGGSNTFSCGIYDQTNGAAKLRRSTNGITINVWQHLVCTYDGSETVTGIQEYKNGIAETMIIQTDDGAYAGMDNTNLNLEIGRWQDDDGVLRGQYDEFRIYNRVLSQEEITALANGDLPQQGVTTFTLQDSLDVNGNLFINTGTLDVSASDYTINAGGGWLNHGGDMIPRSGTVIFDAGSGDVSILQQTSFYGVHIDDAGGGATFTLESSLYIDGTLDIEDGTLDTNSTDNFDMTIAGSVLITDTFNGNASTINVGGNWDAETGSGTFNDGTSTVNFYGSGTIMTNTSTQAENAENTWHNLMMAATGQTTTLLGHSFHVEGSLTFGGGTVAEGQSETRLRLQGTGSVFDPGTASFSDINVHFQSATDPQYIPGGTYMDIQIHVGSGRTTTLVGDVILGRHLYVNASNTVVTNGYDLTVTNNIFLGSSTTNLGHLIASGDSVLDLNNVDIRNTTGTASTFIMQDTSTAFVSGDFLFSEGSENGLFDGGTSTITFDSTNASENIFADGSTFYNVVIDYSDADDADDNFALNNDMNIDGTLRIIDGELVQGNNDINVAGNVDIQASGSFTKSTISSRLFTLDGDLSYNDSSNPQQDLGRLIIGSSPDTTTLTSDLKASSLFIDAGDVLITDGYDVYISGSIDIDGLLNATSGTGGDTVITVGDYWDATGGTFTADTSTVLFTSTSGSHNVTTAGNAFNDVVFGGGLVGYWKMDETSSPAIDYSGYGNNGTWNSGATSADERATLNFNNSKSLYLPTSGDYIDVGDHDVFSFTDGNKNDTPFTFAFWIRPTAWDIVDGPISKDDGTTSEYYMYIIGGSNTFSCGVYDETNGALKLRRSTNGITINVWQHLVCTYDGSETVAGIQEYKNGVAETMITQVDGGTYAGMDNTSVSLNIGRYADDDGVLRGYYDDFRIYNRVLSQAEITALANGNLPIGEGATYTLQDNLDVNGGLSIGNGTFDVGTGNTINVAGGWLNHGGGFEASTTTIVFDNQSDEVFIQEQNSFYNILFDDGGNSGTFTLYTSLGIDGTLKIGDGELDVSGSFWPITVGADWIGVDTFTARTGTVTFNKASGGSNINADNMFYNLVIDDRDGGSDMTVTLNDDLDVNGTFLVRDGGFDQGVGFDLNVAGNFTIESGNTYTKATGTGTLVLDGDLDFADNTSPQQDLGRIQIGTSPDTTTMTTDMTGTSLKIAIGDELITDGYEITMSGSIDIDGTLTATNGTDGTTTIDVGGTFDMTGGIFTNTNSTVLFTGTSFNNTLDIVSDSKTFYNVKFNDNGGGTTWELEDDFAVDGTFYLADGIVDTNTSEDNDMTIAGTFNIVGGNMTANASTITTSNDFFIENVAGLFTGGTATVVFDGDANAYNRNTGNKFEQLVISSGVTITLTDRLATEKIDLEASSTITGSTRLLIVDPTENDPIDQDSTATISVDILDILPDTLTSFSQKAITTAAEVRLNYSNQWTVTMTDDWIVGDLTIHGNNASNTEAEAGTLDTNGNNLTVNGDLGLGFPGATAVYWGKIDFASGTHTITGNLQNNTTDTAEAFFELGSADISVGGDIDWNLSTVTPGTSTITFNGAAAQTITADSSTFYNVAVTNASGSTVTFNDSTTFSSFTSTVANVQIEFLAGGTFEITGTLTLDGQAMGTEITLDSTDHSTRFNFDISAAQSVEFVEVSRSEVLGSGDITATGSTEGDDTDAGEGTPEWVFSSAAATCSSSDRVCVQVLQIAAPTSTGTQDITLSGFGVPKAAMITVTNATANGTEADHNMFSIGATDCTNQAVFATVSEHGQTGVDAGRRATEDEIVLILEESDQSLDAEANFDSCITDGIRINWVSAVPDDTFLMTVTLYTGTELSTHVNTFVSSAVINDTMSTTDPGFEPDQLIHFSHQSAWDDTSTDAYTLSYGFADNGPSIVQGSNYFLEVHASGTGDPRSIVSDSYWMRNGTNDAMEVTSFDVSGFTVTTRFLSASHEVGYLALNYNSAVDHGVFFMDSPTSTGDDAITGIGFEPQYVSLIMSTQTAYDSNTVNDEAGAFGLSQFTNTQEYSVSVNTEDASVTTDTQSLVNNKAVHLELDDGTAAFEADFTSMDTDGFTLNYTAANGTTRKWIGLAIGVDETQITGTSNLADSTSVRWAQNATLRSHTGMVISGSFAITIDSTLVADDVVTVWADGVTDANESTAITIYDGAGDITGMVLNSGTLSFGSDDSPMTVNITDLGQYDAGDDEDIVYSLTAGNTIDTTIATTLGNVGMLIGTNGTLDLDGYNVELGGTLTIEGTLDASSGTGGNVQIDVGGGWDMTSGVFTNTASTVLFTGTSDNNSFDIFSSSKSFYHVMFDDAAGGTTWELEDGISIDGSFQLDDGIFDTNSTENNTVDVLGTLRINGGRFNANASTITVSQSFESVFDDAFIEGTSTIDLIGTGNFRSDTPGSGDAGAYNLRVAAPGQTTTISSSPAIGNVIHIGTGTVTGSSVLVRKTDGVPITTDGGTISISAWVYRGAVFVAGIDHVSRVSFRPNGTTYQLQGNFSTFRLLLSENAGGGTATLDTTSNNYSITVDEDLFLGDNSNASRIGHLILNDSVLDIGDDMIFGAAGTLNIIEADAAQITVVDNWNNSNSGTHSLGTSTVTFDGATGTSTITVSGDSFYNLVIDDADGGADYEVLLAGTMDVFGTLTIADGDFDVSASNYDIGVRGNWVNSGGTFTARNATVTFDGTVNAQTITSNSDTFYNVAVANTSGSSTVTFNDSTTFNNFTSTVASGQIEFLAGGTFEIDGTLTLDGQASGTRITLDSTDHATRWNFDIPGDQLVSFVEVARGEVIGTGDITATTSVDGADNDSGEGTPEWVFVSVMNLYTWTGASDAEDWTDQGNWDIGDGSAGDDGYPDDNMDAVLIDSTSHTINSPTGTFTIAEMDMIPSFTGTLNLQGTLVADNAGAGSGDVMVTAGTLTHPINTTSEDNWLAMVADGNFELGSGAIIYANGRGYSGNSPAGNGPGGGSASGGTYGGIGGDTNEDGSPATTYGSIIAPINIGSGGVSFSAAYGGGAVIITTVGTMTVDGTITADGTEGTTAGGAGGSVFLTVGNLEGTGTLQANGADQSTGGGGGGGRVAVVLTASGADFTNFDVAGTMNAFGGDGSGVLFHDGAAGTVYRETQAQVSGTGELVINNNDLTDTGVGVYTLMPTSVNLNNFSNIIINNAGDLAVDADDTLDFTTISLTTEDRDNATITIADETGVTFPNPYSISGYTLNANDVSAVTGDWTITSTGRLSHSQNGDDTLFAQLNITLTGDLTVDALGEINVDGKGYVLTSGPGAPSGGLNGGGYGGLGGDDNSDGHDSNTYGSITAPTDIGSAGNANSDGRGAGAIQLDISGALTNNGTITASGITCSSGCGSGGSIYITADSLAGSGEFHADGGSGGSGGGGGGGRIAVVLTGADEDFSTFDVAGTFTAYGGDEGGTESGAAGTIYKQSEPQGSGNGILIIDNNNVIPTGLVFTHIDSLNGNLTTVGSLVIQDDGALFIGSDDELIVGGTLTTLTMDTTGSLSVYGTLQLGGTSYSIASGATTDFTGTLSEVVYIGQDDDATVTPIITTYGTIRFDNEDTTFSLGDSFTSTNFIDESPGTTLTFAAGRTFTVTGSLILDGQSSANRITLDNDGGSTRWNFNIASSHTTQFLDISNGEVIGVGDITANSSLDTTNNDTGEGTPQWIINVIFAVAGSTDHADGVTVRFASNGVIDGGSDTTLAGAFSVETGGTITFNAGDIITVWADSVADSLESTAITEFDGNGDVSGMALNIQELSIGSNDGTITITPTELATYDNDDNEDLVFVVTSGNTIDTYINNTTSIGLAVVSNGTLDLDGNEIEIAGTLTIAGTLDASSGTDGNTTLFVGGGFDATSGVFTNTDSTVTFTGTATDLQITSAGASFNNLTITGTTGLVGYWKLDETASPAIDFSGFGNDGVWNGNTFSTSTSGTINFANAQSALFDSAGDFITIADPGDNSILDFNTDEQITLSAWIRANSLPNDTSVILVKGSNETTRANYQFGTRPDAGTVRAMSFSYRNAADTQGQRWQTSTNVIEDQVWYHVAVTYTFADAASPIIYVNGQAIAGTWGAGTGAEDPLISNDALWIGNNDFNFDATPDEEWVGEIDEVRIYRRTLSATEIQSLADGNMPSTGVGTYTLQDALDVNGTLTLNDGTLDTGTNYDINVGRDWLNHGGIFSPNSSTVFFDGSATDAQILSGSQTFYGADITGSGTWTLQDDIPVSNNLDVSAGVLTYDITGSFQPINVEGDTTITGGTFTGNTGRFRHDGDLTIDTGTYTAPTDVVEIDGSFTHSGGTFTNSSSTVMFTGTSVTNTIDTTGGAQFQNLIVNNDLIGYWKMDEASSPSLDYSGFGNDGQWNDSVSSNTDVSGTLNFASQSLEFDGTDDYIGISDTDELSSLSAFTMSVWVKSIVVVGGDRVVISKGEESVNIEYRLRVVFAAGPDSVNCHYSDDGTSERGGSDTYDFVENTWTHIACTWDGSNVNVYTNGGTPATFAATQSMTDAGVNLAIGAYSGGDGSGKWDGQIDEVRIYKRALSSTEIESLADGNMPGIGDGTYTLQTTLDVNGTLILNDGTLDTGTNNTINVGGDWLNHGGQFSPNSSTVFFDGTATGAQILSGSQTFYGADITGSGTWTLQDDIPVSNNLDISAGVLTYDITGSFQPINVEGDTTITGGTFTGNTGRFRHDGDLTIDTGTYTAPTDVVEIDGSFTHSGGTFTNSSSTVMFTGTSVTNTIDTTGGTQFQNLIVNNDLIGYWKMDEASSPAIDRSGYGHEGVWINSPNFSTSTSGTINFNNPGSINLDGINQYIDIEDTDELSSLSAFTLTAWVKSTVVVGGGKAVISKGEEARNKEYRLRVIFAAGPDSVNCHYSDDGTSERGGSDTYDFVENTWTHIACTWDGSNVNVYTNGGTPATFAATQSMTDAGVDLAIGAYSGGDGSGEWDGQIDEVRIYKRALSSTEVESLANGNMPGIGDGSYTLQTALDVDGTLVLNAGVLDVGSNYQINVGGDWNNNGGVFAEQNGAVVMDGTDQWINSSETFYNFTKTLSAGPSRTLTFGQSSTVTITNSLTLSGFDASNYLNLRSSSVGVRYDINTPNSTQTENFLSVADSNAEGNDITAIDSENFSNTDAGEGTPQWIFGAGSGPKRGAIMIVD